MEMYSEPHGASLCGLCGHQTPAPPCFALQIATVPSWGMPVASCVMRFTSSSSVEIQTSPASSWQALALSSHPRASGYRCRFQYAIPKASFRVWRLIHLPVFLHLLPIVRAKIGDRCEQMPRKNSYATYQNCCTRLLRISSPQCTVHPTDHCRLRWSVSLT
jgi:hypothetical protein